MGRNKFGFRKFINVEDVQAALKQLNISSFIKSWRDSTSEYGIICDLIGRKNNKQNRLRIRIIIKRLNKQQTEKTQASTDHSSNSSNVKELVKPKNDFQAMEDTTNKLTEVHDKTAHNITSTCSDRNNWNFESDDRESNKAKKRISQSLPKQSAKHYEDDDNETGRESTKSCITGHFAVRNKLTVDFESDDTESIDEGDNKISHSIPKQSAKHYEDNDNETEIDDTKPCITPNFSDQNMFNVGLESDDTESIDESDKGQKVISESLSKQPAAPFEDENSETFNDSNEPCTTSKFLHQNKINSDFQTDHTESIEEESIEESKKGKKLISPVFQKKSSKHYRDDANDTGIESTKACITNKFSDQKKFNVDLESDDTELIEESDKGQKKRISYSLPKQSAKHYEDNDNETKSDGTKKCITRSSSDQNMFNVGLESDDTESIDESDKGQKVILQSISKQSATKSEDDHSETLVDSNEPCTTSKFLHQDKINSDFQNDDTESIEEGKKEKTVISPLLQKKSSKHYRDDANDTGIESTKACITDKFSDQKKFNVDLKSDDTELIEESDKGQKKMISYSLPKQSAKHYEDNDNDTESDGTKKCITRNSSDQHMFNVDFESDDTESIEEEKKEKKVISPLLQKRSSKHYRDDANDTGIESTKTCITDKFSDQKKFSVNLESDDTELIHESNKGQKKIFSYSLPKQSAKHYEDIDNETESDGTKKCITRNSSDQNMFNVDFESDDTESIEEGEKEKKVISPLLQKRSSKHYRDDANDTGIESTKACITDKFSDRKKFNVDIESDDTELIDESNKGQKKTISYSLPKQSAKHYEDNDNETESDGTKKCITRNSSDQNMFNVDFESDDTESIEEGKKEKKVISPLLQKKSSKHYRDDANDTGIESTKACITDKFSDQKKFNVDLESDDTELIDESNKGQKKRITYSLLKQSAKHFVEDQNDTVVDRTEPCITSKFSDQNEINSDFERESTKKDDKVRKIISHSLGRRSTKFLSENIETVNESGKPCFTSKLRTTKIIDDNLVNAMVEPSEASAISQNQYPIIFPKTKQRQNTIQDISATKTDLLSTRKSREQKRYHKTDRTLLVTDNFDDTESIDLKSDSPESKTNKEHFIVAPGKAENFSKSTIESTIGMSVPDNFFEKDVPTVCSFVITDQVWSSLCKGQKKRCFKSGTWEHIISNGIKSINPYCVYMFKWHKVTIAKHKSKGQRKFKAKNFPLFRGEGLCKFTNCNNKCQFHMDDKKIVHATISPKVNHQITEYHARPIRGKQRQKLRNLFKSGKKPYKHYLEEMKKTPMDVKIAGNFSNFGNTTRTLQEIATESRYTNKLDKNDFESMVILSGEMAKEIERKKIHGFIQHISILPPYVMYWTEDGVRIWHDMAKDGIVYWDATGTVLRSRQDKWKYFYYELACSNPVIGQPVIPVSSMVSSIHSTPVVKFWLGEFRRSEKRIFGHANAAIPHQVTSDRSMVFIQSALTEFNSENLDSFRSRAHRIVTGKAKVGDLRGIFPHTCLSHVMASFKKLVSTHYKSNFEFGMYLFSILLNANTMADVEEILHAVYYVLLSKYVNRKVVHHFELLLNRMSKLDRDADALCDISVDTVYTEEYSNILLFEENQNPDLLTEEDFATRSTKNEFAAFGEKILKKVNEELTESKTTGLPINRRYSQTIQEKIHKLFIPTLPLWSNILIGDLSRHGTSDIYNKFVAPTSIVRGNSRIEKRFQILKDIELDGKPLNRFDELSVRLKEHTVSVQQLGVIKSIKTRQGRSSKTIKEEWDKKKVSKQQNTLLGKYQTCPKASTLQTFAKTTINSDISKKADSKSKNAEKVNVPATENETVVKEIEVSKAKLFASDSMFSNTLIGLRDSQYLDEIYTFKAKDHQNWNYLTTVKDTRTGLTNLGNSCWFNSVVQLYANSKFMRNVNENFNYQLSYEEKLRSVLEVFDRVGKGKEVSKNHIQLALNDLHMLYGLHSSQQNDAHEFTVTGIEHCMGLFGDDCLIKIMESYVCTVCGKSINLEQQVYNDIQLAIPPDVLPHEGIRELLDRYFEGEEVDSCCCGDSKRWRHVTISEFPSDLSICLIRYSIKNNRSVKNRKPITLNNLINLGKYTEPRIDILYSLTGVVIHHGSSPKFGHYTFLKYDGGVPIVINDDTFSVYQETYHLTDNYLLQYEQIPEDKDICHSHLPHLIIALTGCVGWNKTVEAMTNASNISVRARMILNYLEQIELDECTVTHSWRAYRLIQEAIGPVNIFNGSNQFETLINSMVSYICSNNQSLMSDNFGLTTVKRTSCLTCQHTTTNTVHQNCIDFQNLMPLKSIISNDEFERCTVCKEERPAEIKHCILKYGRTVFIKGNSEILHPDGFSQIISKFTPKAVICSMFTFVFRQIGNDVEILQIESPNMVTEVSMEKIKSVADQYKQDLIVIADKVDEAETINNYQIINETTFVEPDNNLNLHLQSCDVKFMDGFSAPLQVNGYRMECEEVSRFLCGQFSDINIDTFFSTLILENSLIIPSSWFASNIGTDKTNKTEGKETWFDKDSIYLPINVNRNHWILTVIFPKDTLIHHLDPLGNKPTFEIVNSLCNFLNHRNLIENFNSDENVWRIDDLMTTKKFPVQKTADSCGAMICIYAKMLEQNAVMSGESTDKQIRQYIFHEVIEAYRTKSKNENRFGVHTIIFTPDIDEIVKTIVQGKQSFNTEHYSFLRNPNSLHRKKMCNFAVDYISQADFIEITEYLFNKFFWCKKGLFTINCKQCIFPEAEELNLKLKENFQNAIWYVDCVLVKGVIVEVLRRSLNAAPEDIWNLCKLSEFSSSEAIRNDIQLLRETRRKEKEERWME